MSHGERWVSVGAGLDRIKVPGGWLYRVNLWTVGLDGFERLTSQSMAFVPAKPPKAQRAAKTRRKKVD